MSRWFDSLANNGTEAIPLLSQIPEYAPSVISTAGAVAWVAGAFITLASIFQLKALGEGARYGSVVGPIVRLGIAVCLMSLPTVIDTAVMTVWGGGPQTFSYAPTIQAFDASKYFESLRYFFKMIGLFAIIKSLLIFNRMTTGDQREGFWKGAIHFIAGGFCWNFNALLELFKWAFNI